MADDIQPEGAAKRAAKCPICKAPSDARFRPFCSKRCGDIDLGRWLSGSYAIAGRSDDEDGAEAGDREISEDDLSPPKA